MSAIVTIPTPDVVAASSILDLPHGLYLDYDAERYHQRVPGMASKTALDLVYRSLANYQTWLCGADRDTAALRFGKALHCAVLEPEWFGQTYIAQPDFGDCRTKEPKAARDRWRAEHGIDSKGNPIPGVGRLVLKADDMTVIRGISASIRRHSRASKMLANGTSEVTMRWRDEASGLECKGRVDYYVQALAMAIDVKTTEDARSPAFSKSIAIYRYHVQHAFYADAFRTLGQPLQAFAFIAAEKSAPYNVAVYTLDPSEVIEGWEDAQRDLATLADGYETGEFPGYDEQIQIIKRPAWARRNP